MTKRIRLIKRLAHGKQITRRVPAPAQPTATVTKPVVAGSRGVVPAAPVAGKPIVILGETRSATQYRAKCSDCSYEGSWTSESGATAEADAHSRSTEHVIEVIIRQSN